MSLYTDASLIMYPSGYKEDKIYSLKPTDGSGDLTFTRASTATRVNAEGLIEESPVNLLTYSEQFDSVAWTKNSSSITANSTSAPNGTSTADSFTSAISTANHLVYQLLSGVSGAYTFSVYVKKANSRYVYIKLVGDASQWVAAAFDLNDGTLTKSEATGWTGLSASSQSVGNGWYKLIVSGSGATSVNFNVGIQYTNTGTPTFAAYADASFTGTGTIDYYIWGAQVNIGATVKPYFPTTDRLNVPRIDYTSGCGSLLLEPQRTNNVTYSEQLNNAAWALVNAGSASAPIVTANYGISPDGSQNAERVQFSRTGTTASDYSLLDRSTISTAAGVVSFYGKSLSGTQSILLYYGSVGQVFTLTTEWQRFSLYSPTTTTDLTIGTRGGTGLYYTGGSLTIDCLLWGFQKEEGTYVSSYVPTLASSVTRLADAAYKTGISSLIGQTSGTLYWEVQKDAITSNTRFQLSDGTSNNWLFVSVEEATLQIRIYAGVLAGTNVDVTSVATLNNNAHKIAFAYAENDFKVYVDGVAFLTHTSGDVPACSRLDIGNNSPTGAVLATSNISQAILFPTRLTNAQLATLTTI